MFAEVTAANVNRSAADVAEVPANEGGLPLPAGSLPEPPIVRDGDHALPPRVHSDLDRMMALVDRMWHRLVEAIAHAQKQMLNKS